MFEARLTRGELLKKVIEALKDLVNEANFDISSTGIQLQAMDSSHVSLCALVMKAEGFDHFRCDRSMPLGINLLSMAKVLKCCNKDDIVTLKAEDDGDSINFMFESKDQDKISDFELKLMDIDSEHLGIPETDYKATVTMNALEFSRICSDLSILGETVAISVGKDGVKFSVSGEMGTGNMTVRDNGSSDVKEGDRVDIEMEEPVNLNFAMRYLKSFAKAAPLCDRVQLCLSRDVPLLVKYDIPNFGSLSYYLAPKIDDEA
ncbi:proliferating cell nuclear antigen [Pavlovales sp. CCMP2436]|nr:proliferating cell nuclear antigen [Pavlovales sp. CCMP2436]